MPRTPQTRRAAVGLLALTLTATLAGFASRLCAPPAHARSGADDMTPLGVNAWTRGGPAGGHNISVLEIAPSNPDVIYTWQSNDNATPRDRGIYKSSDGGANWTRTTDFDGQVVSSLAVDPTNASIVYAGTNHRGIAGNPDFKPNGVYKSTDGGVTWSVTGLAFTGGPAPRAIEIDPANPSVVYAANYNGPWKTTNGGASWSGLPQPRVGGAANTHSIAVSQANNLRVYTATNGIHISPDGGATWINAGLPGTGSVKLDSVVADPTNANR